MNSLLVWIRWFPLYQHSNSYPKKIRNSEVTSDMLLVTYQNPEKKKNWSVRIALSERHFPWRTKKKENGQPPAETNRLGGSVTTFFCWSLHFPSTCDESLLSLSCRPAVASDFPNVKNRYARNTCGAVSSAIFGWEPSWWVGQHMDGLDEWRLSLLSPYHTGSPRKSVSSVSSKAAMEEIDTKGVSW